MKKRLILLSMTLMLTASVFIGCGNTKTADTTKTVDVASVEDTTTPVPTETPTEAPHEHAYNEEITTPATCEADGVKTFTCECGDTYTEVITTTGHIFEAYTSNNDATYTADGTETAKCSNCDVTDTRTAEGSMLTYTYTDMDATMYAQQTVNVRSLPNTDGEKLGGLNQNDEVHVTGQCAETSWYRIEYSGGVAYVSNNYLGADKVVVQASAPATSSEQNTSSEFPYELYTVYNDLGYSYFYCLESDLTTKPDIWYAKHQECEIANGHQYLTYDNWTITQSGGWRTNHKASGYTLNGEKVMMATNFSSKEQLQNRGLW